VEQQEQELAEIIATLACPKRLSLGWSWAKADQQNNVLMTNQIKVFMTNKSIMS
jgi:hypothetical protein